MRLDDERESSNIEDRRGDSGGGFGGFGGFGLGGRSIGIVGTIVIALVSLYFGVDPSVVLNSATSPAVESSQYEPAHSRPADDAGARFVSKILADTEDTWKEIFAESGRQYIEPRLVLFSGITRTACGTGQAAMGPFIVPATKRFTSTCAFISSCAIASMPPVILRRLM